jgi:hypothetical protein
MNTRTFFLQLVCIFIALIGIEKGLCLLLVELEPHWLLFWLAQWLFVAISVGLFFLGNSASKSENKNLFSQVVMVATFIKMLFSILVVIIYVKKIHPDGKWFLIPFFGAYLIYTIFETYFMSKLGRQKTVPPSSRLE